MNRKKSVFAVFLVLSLVLVGSMEFKVVKAEPRTIVVPDDYSTINEAIQEANDGDTVFVKSGTYYEHLVIDKTVFLKGENKQTTKIHRRGQAYPEVYPTIVVRADNVNITGLTIQNAISSPSETTPAKAEAHSGIHLLQVNNCNVYENIIINSGYGVWLFGSTNNSIFHNEISNVANGIVIEKSSNNTVSENRESRIDISSSSNNTIVDNIFSGITIKGSSNNLVMNNEGSNSDVGIFLSSSTSNILRNNQLTNASRNFGITGTMLSHFLNDIDTSNTINSKKIYYFINETSLNINPVMFPDLGALVVVNCTDVSIQNLNIIRNYWPVSPILTLT